jgi:hypothetical protein
MKIRIDVNKIELKKGIEEKQHGDAPPGNGFVFKLFKSDVDQHR